MEKKYLDKRVIDRYVAKGIVKREEAEKMLKTLPDSESEGTWVQMDLHDTEMSEEDVDEAADADIS